MSGGKTYPTVEEAISLLSKSEVPTVITEGRDDFIVFRHLEEQLRDFGVDVLPIGDRKKVLELFERRAEIGRDTGIAYIADRDVWIYSGIPNQYENPLILFSNGYSIENDLFSDGPVVELMLFDEKDRFSDEARRFTRWYALALSRHLANDDEGISNSPTDVLQSKEREEEFCATRISEVFPEQLYKEILGDIEMRLRGKSLIALALRQLASNGRSPKYSKHALMEQCTVRWGPLLGGTRDKLREIFLAA